MSDYNSFADLIGRFPQYAVFRKFAALNAKRLLFLQAELSHLECELAIISQCDQDQNPEFSTSWKKMNGATAEAGANLQSLKTFEMADKLDKYYALLLQSEQVLKLPPPEKSERSFLRFWLNWEKGGKFFLKGIEGEPYEETHADDLLTLSPTAKQDPLAQYIGDKITPLYHRHAPDRIKPTSYQGLGQLWEYKHTIFMLLGDVICAIFSSTIPITSICLLYYVKSMFKKLVVVATMNFLFSFIMAIGIRARRVDVFAASTAFAAVQVVFIGGVSYIVKQD